MSEDGLPTISTWFVKRASVSRPLPCSLTSQGSLCLRLCMVSIKCGLSGARWAHSWNLAEVAHGTRRHGYLQSLPPRGEYLPIFWTAEELAELDGSEAARLLHAQKDM